MFKKTTLFGTALALALLLLALWKIDLDKLFASLASANYWYVLPASLTTLAGYVLRTVRWKGILRPTRVITLRDLFPILMIGFMANNVLPARVGEFVRAYALDRRTSVGKTLGLSTIILERVFDGLTLVLFIGLLSLLFPLPEWGTGLARLAGGLFISSTLIVVVLAARAESANRLAALIARLLPQQIGRRIGEMVGAALLGLQALERRRALLGVAALSVLVWTAEAVSYLMIIRGFNLGLAPGTASLAAVFVLVVVNLAIMLPSAPGYIGTFQAFAVLALGAFGVQREAALGVAVVSHSMQYLLVTGIGLLFLWRGRLDLLGIAKQEVVT